MELSYSESKRSTANKSINLNKELVMEKLVYVNPNKEDNCEISNLNPEWKTILSNYMSSRYITCNKYEVIDKYFIAIDCIDDDIISVLNNAKITIYAIDRIVDFLSIKFQDSKTRDLVFDVLNKKVV